jgi:hypothetical protein
MYVHAYDALRNHVMREGPINLVAIGLPNDESGVFSVCVYIYIYMYMYVCMYMRMMP